MGCRAVAVQGVVVGLALCLAAHPALASSQDLFGLGARGAAMGGAAVSNSAGFPAIYYNPAALGRVEGITFTLGYQRADYGLDLNGSDYPVDPASNLLLGFNVPIPFGGVLADRFCLGLGFVLPTQSVLRADIPMPETPSFVLVEDRPQVVGVHAGLSVRLFDWLRAGFSVVALAKLVGSLAVEPNDLGTLGSIVRDELVADYAPIAGLLVSPVDWLDVGVAFHAESESPYTFPITADLGEGFPIDVPLLDVSGVAQYDPMEVSSDVTVRPLTGLLLAGGVTWKRWSEFANPVNNTTDAVPPQDPPDFHDTVVGRLGAEYTLAGSEMTWAFRTGGFLEPTPAPEQVGNHNYLDNTRLGIGLGAGWRWRSLLVDLGFQLQLLLERTDTKDAAQVRDPENAGLPSITHSGHIFVSDIEVGVVF